jgi:hypothetical protein
MLHPHHTTDARDFHIRKAHKPRYIPLPAVSPYIATIAVDWKC